MTTKFLLTRSYRFEAEKGRRKHYFFHVVERHSNKVTFRLTDKDNTEEIETDVVLDGEIERAGFVCKGAKIELHADRYTPKGVQTPRLPEPELRQWMKTREDALRDAHLHSSRHREEMLESKQCGCYSCQRIFSTDEVEDWADNGETAICPYCGTDAVVPNVPGVVKITPEMLSKLNEKYF